MKKALVAVMAGAALSVATVSNAQAQDEAGPFIAGAVIGTVVGVVLAKRHLDVFDEPVEPAPPPQVVVVERPVVVKRGPPPHAHHHHHHRDWHERRYYGRR